MLGVTSGLELIARIHSELGPPLPAIIAASGLPGLQAEACRRGADLYLPKPFDLDTLRDAVTSLVARRPVDAGFVERASRESRRLREGAAAAAHAALARLAPRMPDVVRRGEWTVRWPPRYFGFGHAFYAIHRDDRLALIASSDPDWLPIDSDLAARLPLCRDILETSSAMVLPDAAALRGAIGDDRVRFFAGVPLLRGPVAIGVFCLVDAERHTIEAEDLALLEAAGRRASAIFSGDDLGTAPFWAALGVAARETLLLAMQLELRRASRNGTWLHLLAFSSPKSEEASSWAGALDEVALPRRRMLAALGGDRFALLLVRGAGETHELFAAVQLLRHQAALAGGGLVSMEGADLVGVSERELVALAGAMLDRQLRVGRREVEHVVIRREAWPGDAADGDQPAAR
jgi:hypothetical protein